MTDVLEISNGLRRVLGAIDIAPDGRRCVIGPTVLTADTRREMTRQLAEAIYNRFHSGQDGGGIPSRLRDRDVEARLRAATPHHAAHVPVRFLRAGSDDRAGQVLVEWHGVRVWIPTDVLDEPPPDAPRQVFASLPSVRPAVSPGFFLAEGSCGRPRTRELVRVYVHVPGVAAALRTWRVGLGWLEETGVQYQAKVLSVAEFYPRRDALVAYLPTPRRDVAVGLAQVLVDTGDVAPGTSCFAEPVREGIGLAAEPSDPHPGRQDLSFGQHRATVVAAAVVDTADRPEHRGEEVVRQCTAAGIDPARPWQNLA